MGEKKFLLALAILLVLIVFIYSTNIFALGESKTVLEETSIQIDPIIQEFSFILNNTNATNITNPPFLILNNTNTSYKREVKKRKILKNA